MNPDPTLSNTQVPPTAEEQRLRVLLRLLAIVFALAAFGYLMPALVGDNKSFFIHLPFVTNSAVKVSVLAILCFLAAADVRRYRSMVWAVIIGHLLSEVAVAAVLIWGEPERLVTMAVPFTGDTLTFPIANILVGSMLLDGVIIILLWWFARSAERSFYRLSYLSPLEYRSLTALAEALIVGKDEVVSPDEMARNADRYLNGFRARTKWVFKATLMGMEIYPILSLHPPLSMMNPWSRRRFLEQRFYRGVSVLPAFWRTIVQVMIRIAKQIAYLGYYNDPRTFPTVGYVPFEQRRDTPMKKILSPPAQRRPLQVTPPAHHVGEKVVGDIVIVGTGAAASIMAHRILSEYPDRSVIMVERGDHVDPSAMNEDELDMLSKLYNEGALQLSRDFRFQVLQGSCVGGSTVVNNAVCFDLPANVLDRWNDPNGLDAGLDARRLEESHERVRRLINVERQNHPNLNPGALPFIKGLTTMGLHMPPNQVGTVEANINDCYGCGQCNIGCRYGKKLSMLDTVLPDAQEKFGPDRLKIFDGCEGWKLSGKGEEVTSLRCRMKDGRLIDIEGKTFVVAAGAVSSSLILLRSGIGGDRAGEGLSFNMGSPMTGVFDRKIDAYAGLQISHYILRQPSQGYIIETWFNPPVSQALTMPGWFDDHFANMLRYDRMSSAGILVPTESNASVRRTGIFGRDIAYAPTKNDLASLAEGLILAGEVFFAGGATSVMPHTHDFREWSDPSELTALRQIVQTKSAITLGTGHPQGGNRLSRNAAVGVVDPDFRAYGYRNLFVCDASVFPSSIGVNPQMTVMALADYAAPVVGAS